MPRPGLKERYLRDPVPIRLGNLASNLARVSTCVRDIRVPTAARELDDALHFIAWTANDVAPETRPKLDHLAEELTATQREWDAIVADERRTADLVARARHWSDQALEWSGLLDQAK